MTAAVTLGGFQFSPKSAKKIEKAKDLSVWSWLNEYDGTSEACYTLSAWPKAASKLFAELAPRWNGNPEIYNELGAPFGGLAKLMTIPYGRFLVRNSNEKIVTAFKEGYYAEGIKNLTELVGIVANAALNFAFVVRLDCAAKWGTYAVFILTISDLTAIYQELVCLKDLLHAQDNAFDALAGGIKVDGNNPVSGAELRSQLIKLSMFRCAKIVIAPLTLLAVAFGSKGPALTNLGNRVIVSAAAMLAIDVATKTLQLAGKRYEAGLYVSRKIGYHETAPAA